MRILLVGGNGFIGRFAVSALTQKGHALAVFHRGTTAAPAGVEEIRGNRNQLSGSAQELKRFVPDVRPDFLRRTLASAKTKKGETNLNLAQQSFGRHQISIRSASLIRLSPSWV